MKSNLPQGHPRAERAPTGCEVDIRWKGESCSQGVEKFLAEDVIPHSEGVQAVVEATDE